MEVLDVGPRAEELGRRARPRDAGVGRLRHEAEDPRVVLRAEVRLAVLELRVVGPTLLRVREVVVGVLQLAESARRRPVSKKDAISSETSSVSGVHSAE